jgi:large subunit ribosomal protein L9
MKVILLEKYRKLGAVGDIVEVKNGYARNFLIPNSKAVQATKSNIEDFEARKEELLKISKKNEDAASKLADKIENKIVATIKQAADDGRLYGSVTTKEISDYLNKAASENIDKKQITISTSIKFLGVYQVEVDLGEGVLANIYVNVARSEGEAEEIEARFLKGEIPLGPLSSEDDKNSGFDNRFIANNEPNQDNQEESAEKTDSEKENSADNAEPENQQEETATEAESKEAS